MDKRRLAHVRFCFRFVLPMLTILCLLARPAFSQASADGPTSSTAAQAIVMPPNNEQLERERIREVVDEDTNVFLWAHPDRLIETLDLADCWGLGYRRAILSIPPKTFLLEQSPHLLLHFQIGDAKLVDTDIASWILCPQPDDVGVPLAVRRAIQRRVSLPLLEIFARTRPPNSDWTVVDYPAQPPMT